MGPIMKQCSKCKQSLPLSNFYKERRSFRADCKRCETRRVITHYYANKESWLRVHKAYVLKIRKQVIEHYGGKCACCGETTLEFLGIDHKRGGGNKHRKALNLYGYNFYLWIIRNNYPKSLQVLCHNCNLAKGFYGVCPHSK